MLNKKLVSLLCLPLLALVTACGNKSEQQEIKDVTVNETSASTSKSQENDKLSEDSDNSTETETETNAETLDTSDRQETATLSKEEVDKSVRDGVDRVLTSLSKKEGNPVLNENIGDEYWSKAATGRFGTGSLMSQLAHQLNRTTKDGYMEIVDEGFKPTRIMMPGPSTRYVLTGISYSEIVADSQGLIYTTATISYKTDDEKFTYEWSVPFVLRPDGLIVGV